MNKFRAISDKDTIELGMCNPNPYHFSYPYYIEQGDEYKEDSNIFRTYGATHALSLSLTVLSQWFYYVNKTPTLYLYAPFYLDYVNIIKYSGWKYNVEIVADLKKIPLKPTSVLLINFPNNPTGRDATDNEVRFFELFSKVGFLISDIVYHNMLKPCKVIIPRRGIVIYSLSKAFTWCGLRNGTLSLVKNNGEKMNEFLRTHLIEAIRSTVVCPISSKIYKNLIIKAILFGRRKRIKKWYVSQWEKMKKVLDRFELSPNYETGYAPFFFIHCPEELIKFLESKKVNVLRGDLFGVHMNMVRISTAVSTKTIKRFEKVLEEYFNGKKN